MEERFYAYVEFRNGEIVEDYSTNKIDAIIFCQSHYLQYDAIFASVYDNKNNKPVWEWNLNNPIIF